MNIDKKAQLEKALFEYRHIKLVKEYPNSLPVGSKFTPTDHSSDYRSNEKYCVLSHETILKFYTYFEPLPFTYEILEKDSKENILSVKRLRDGEIFTVGNEFSNTVAEENCKKKNEPLTTWKLVGFLIKKDVVYLLFDRDEDKNILNCGIGAAIKIA